MIFDKSHHPWEWYIYQWLFLVPLKGGIGGIVHPPIGRKNAFINWDDPPSRPLYKNSNPAMNFFTTCNVQRLRNSAKMILQVG